MKILVVEDEKKVASFIRSGLRSEGYTVDVAQDGEEGLFLAHEGGHDLIILDLMLPKMDGLSVCRRLRAEGKSMPIIMLTAKDEVDDRVKGLEAGADDYLAKPFSFAELLARIKALSRRGHELKSETLSCADVRLHPDRMEVTKKGKPVNLSATEFKLLKYLMQNRGRVLSKAMILENIWGYDFDPESNIVDVYIKYIRDKVGKSLIQTVRGIGYKLCD